jgi:hypothetical protein
MRRLMVLSCAAVLAACAKKDQPPAADSSAMMTPPAATMADMAGKWTMQNQARRSDSVLLTYELNCHGRYQRVDHDVPRAGPNCASRQPYGG